MSSGGAHGGAVDEQISDSSSGYSEKDDFSEVEMHVHSRPQYLRTHKHCHI